MKLNNMILIGIKRLGVICLIVTTTCCANRSESRTTHPPLPTFINGEPATETGISPKRVGPNMKDSADLSADIDDIKNQLTNLQEEMFMLQEKLDKLTGENSHLRRMPDADEGKYANPYEKQEASSPWAIPPRPKTSDEQLNNEETIYPNTPAGALDYTPVLEWGRTPEDVAGWEGRVYSLKGMICVIPPGGTDEQLLELGRRLRTEFTAYDNINIEVFDEEASARRFAEARAPNPAHRVLTVSKDRETDRDVILLIKGEKVDVVPWNTMPRTETEESE